MLLYKKHTHTHTNAHSQNKCRSYYVCVFSFTIMRMHLMERLYNLCLGNEEFILVEQYCSPLGPRLSLRQIPSQGIESFFFVYISQGSLISFFRKRVVHRNHNVINDTMHFWKDITISRWPVLVFYMKLE